MVGNAVGTWVVNGLLGVPAQVDPNDATALLNYADLIRDTPDASEADASKAVLLLSSLELSDTHV